jgi:hypothetical protein
MVLMRPRFTITSKVGMIRTSTGSISVMKISQKQTMRPGRRRTPRIGREQRDRDLAQRDQHRHHALFQSMSQTGTPPVVRSCDPPVVQAER